MPVVMCDDVPSGATSVKRTTTYATGAVELTNKIASGKPMMSMGSLSGSLV